MEQFIELSMNHEFIPLLARDGLLMAVPTRNTWIEWDWKNSTKEQDIAIRIM